MNFLRQVSAGSHRQWLDRLSQFPEGQDTIEHQLLVFPGLLKKEINDENADGKRQNTCHDATDRSV
jgi:hypothetical protein